MPMWGRSQLGNTLLFIPVLQGRIQRTEDVESKSGKQTSELPKGEKLKRRQSVICLLQVELSTVPGRKDTKGVE